MFLLKRLSLHTLIAMVLCLSLFHLQRAQAQYLTAPVVAEIPQYSVFAASETHLPVRVKPRKPQLVRLDAEVGEVSVDDGSKNVTAVMYDKTSIALVPHNPGAAHITVFAKNGALLMARYVVVAEPVQKYIRLRQTCKDKQDTACAVTHIYYCPNLCYKTRIVGSHG